MRTRFIDFLEDCKAYSDVDYILKHIDTFDPALKVILDDKGVTGDDHTIGKRTIETGVAMFSYLADVIVKKGEDGIEFWNVVMHGYSGHKHTDLFAPYFDVSRSQLLWINSIDKLDMFPVIIRLEVGFNLIFRYSIASIELMRKMLVFCDYCQAHKDGTHKPQRMNNLLYGTGDPAQSLRNTGSQKRGATVCQFYDKTTRHALAHGNVFLALPKMMALRLSDDDRESFCQKEYSIQDDPSSIHRIQQDLLGSAESCYQSIRVFFFLYLKLRGKYESYLRQHFSVRENALQIEMIRIIHEDPDGLRNWVVVQSE